VRELAIGVAGLGALGAVGLADGTIGDDVDFTAIYLAIVAAVAWTSRLAVANVSRGRRSLRVTRRRCCRPSA
jgi:hypothetical protein